MINKLIDTKRLKEKIKHDYKRIFSTSKHFVLALIIGISVGFIAGLFGYLLQKVTTLRLSDPRLLYLLPFGAMLIVGMYQFILKTKDPGTNLVISAVHSGDRLPLRMAPLIFVSTIITHLVGGSAGR